MSAKLEVTNAVVVISDRQAQVMDMVIDGQSNAAIALALNITEKTVKFHNTNIFKKYNVTSRSALIAVEIKRLRALVGQSAK